MPDIARRERRLLRPAPTGRRLWAELRSPGHAGQARRETGDNGRLRDCQRRRGQSRARAGRRSDHHGSSSARTYTAGRHGHRPSATAGTCLPVPRIERRGRGVQAGLARGEASRGRPESERADADVPLVGAGAGGTGNRGRRRAAGGRESRAGTAWPGGITRATRAGAGSLDAACRAGSQAAYRCRGYCLCAGATPERGRPAGPGATGRRALDDHIRRAGRHAGRIYRPAQRQPAKPRTQHSPFGREQAAQQQFDSGQDAALVLAERGGIRASLASSPAVWSSGITGRS